MNLNEWYKVENLERVQEELIKKYENGEEDNNSDFHSYRMLKEGKKDSNIESHNVTGDYSDFLAKSIMNKLKNYTDSCQIELEKRLLGDLGGVSELLQIA